MKKIWNSFLIRQDMTEQFSRTGKLIGQENIERLASSRVAVFGVGGVGVVDDLDAGASVGDLFERLRCNVGDVVAAHLQRAGIDELGVAAALYLGAFVLNDDILHMFEPTANFRIPLLQLLVFL